MPPFISILVEELEELYMRQGLSIDKIAEIYGCSCDTINSRLFKFGFKEPRPEFKVTIEEDILRELYYIEKMTYGDIATAFGCDAQTICNRMREYNLKARTSSEIMSAIERTPEWCAKIGAKSRLYKHTDETKTKLSKIAQEQFANGRRVSWNKGKRKGTDPEMENSGHVGMDHWNWQGGISPEGYKNAMTPEAKLWRRLVLERNNFTCQDCGSMPEKSNHMLHAHHTKPQDEYPELMFDISNGRTLCAKCHAKYRRNRNGVDN